LFGGQHLPTRTANFNTQSNLLAIGKESEPVEYPVNAFAVLNFRVAVHLIR
jgi:hypothetical protein